MKFIVLVTSLVMVLEIKHSSSARILAAVPIPFFSHQVAFRPLWQELASRGHEVVLITTNAENSKNVTNLREIEVLSAHDVLERDNMEEIINLHDNFKVFEFMKFMYDLYFNLLECELLHPEVQAIINNKSETFDLVITEFYFPFMASLAERFKCPLIGVVSMDAIYYTHHIFGSPIHPILYPSLNLYFSSVSSFKERLLNVIYYIVHERTIYNMHTNSNTKLIKYVGLSNSFSLDGTIERADLLLINANPVLYHSRPLSAATVNIGGGLHIEDAKPLPKDLKSFLDDATEGVIYFSLGTTINPEHLGNKTFQIIAQTFSELPYKVLWKGDPDLSSIPSTNIKLAKWFPQQDILRHPNVKLFITQGGLQSMEEAIFNGVPCVGLPVIGDQFHNVIKMEGRGFGIALDPHALEKNAFREAVLNVINNPKYKHTAMKLSRFMKDQPMQPLEKAVWWVEYVLRHSKDGTSSYLKGPKIDMYQYFFLDIILFVVLFAVIAFLTIYYSVFYIIALVRLIVRKRKEKLL